MDELIELLPLHLLEAFSQALKGERGELDAWLEVNNEADVRLHVNAYARACVAHATAAKDAEIEALRVEVAKLRNLRADAIHECALANVRAERLAEALMKIAEYEGSPRTPVYNRLKKSAIARTAISAVQEKDDA